MEPSPTRVLGWGLGTWKKHQLLTVLRAYNVPLERYMSKIDLFLQLHYYAEDNGLTWEDRVRALRAPPAEPTILAADNRLQGGPDNVIQTGHLGENGLDVAPGECIVCVRDLTPDNIPSRPITAACTHQQNICLECLARHINVQMETRLWNQISCPHCPSRLSYEDVQAWAAPQIFERYNQMALREAMSTDPNFRWCPAPGCEAGQIHERGADEPIMTCVSCSRRSCFIHQVEWHLEETCAHFEETKRKTQAAADQMEASEALVESTSKACPNPNCGWRIIKNGGCNHMTCLKCGYEFCWICFAPYEEILRRGNTAHNRGCRLHTEQLAAASTRRERVQAVRRRRRETT